MYKQAFYFASQSLFTLLLVAAFLDPHRYCLSERLAKAEERCRVHEQFEKELSVIRKSIPKLNIKEIKAGEGISLKEEKGVLGISVIQPASVGFTDSTSSIYTNNSYLDLSDASYNRDPRCGTIHDVIRGCGGGVTGRHYPDHEGCENEKTWKGREAKEYYFRNPLSGRWAWSTLADGTVVCQDKWYDLICEQGICERTLGNHSGANHDFKFPERPR